MLWVRDFNVHDQECLGNITTDRAGRALKDMATEDARLGAPLKHHPEQSGSEPHHSQGQHHQSFDSGDIMYGENIVEESFCLKRVSLFVSRDLKIFGSFDSGDIMYGENIVEESFCLKRVSLFVSRDLKIFGITEIMIGIIQMLFGLCLNFVESYVFAVLIGVPWWTGIWYIISGSLVVDIINTSNAHLKQVILLMHIVSSIAALIGTAAYFVSLYLMPPLNTNFFYLEPLVLVFLLMALSCLEFVIASMILFLHCTLVVRELYASSFHRNLAESIHRNLARHH
ncbi:uncharacterized protein [Scyliorhinus torazame]|uniref:uncharacterized protein isoform X2 n=1 Tax=Scyliorhinus torazame TaxID=75743 RepID=UPI003B5B91AC